VCSGHIFDDPSTAMPLLLEVVFFELRQLDWVSKHEYYIRMCRMVPRFAAGVAACMGADDFLDRSAMPCTRDIPIALPDKLKRQATIEESFHRAKFAKN
jgi:hypothetical protein